MSLIAILECRLLLLKVRSMVSVRNKNRHKSVFPGSDGRNGYEYALRPNDSDKNDKGRDDTKEDALHFRVVGDDLRLPVLNDRNFQMVTAYSLHLRRCRRYHLSEGGSFVNQ